MRHVGERARAKGKTGLKVRYVSDRTDCRFFFFCMKEDFSSEKVEGLWYTVTEQ